MLTRVLAVVVILGSLYLALVGERIMVLREGEKQAYYTTQRAPQAVIPMLGAISILAGELAGSTLLCWIGLAVLGIFALLFFYGIGLYYIPFFIILLICCLRGVKTRTR